MPFELPLLALAVSAGVVAVWWFRPIVRAFAQELDSAAAPRLGHCPAQLLAASTATSAVSTARSTATVAPSSGPPPSRQEPAGPTRRDFLRRSFLFGWGGVLGAFGAASLGFLWPRLGQGFGSANLVVGSEQEITEAVRDGGRFEFPAGKLYLVAYDRAQDPDGKYAEGADGGLMALYQKCPHLGCRVPWCGSSRWFECPCHGSRYNRWGEYQFGPAPRGMDRFAVRVADGQVAVDTQNVITGPSRGAGALAQPPEGPHCN